MPFLHFNLQRGSKLEERQKYYVDEKSPWFLPEAGWPDGVPRNFDFPCITLYEMLSESANTYPELPAAWFLGSFMTYGRLLERVKAAASGLYRLGIRKGDVLALILPSSFQFLVLYYACARLGIIVTGVNPTLKPAEIAFQLKKFPRLSVAILDALYEPLIAPVSKRLDIRNIISTNIADMLEISPLKKWLGMRLKKIPKGRVPEEAVAFLSLFKSPIQEIEGHVTGHDTAAYLMTGGSTGTPKATVLTHFNCVSNAIQVSLWIRTRKPGACMVGVIPLFHSFGMSAVMNATIYSSMWMMLFPRPPETDELLKTICRIAPDNQTYFPGVEILFKRIAESEDLGRYPAGRKIRGCISGAGPLREDVKLKFEANVGAPLLEGYGLTEASPVVSGGPLSGVHTTGTIGLPLTGMEWKIMDLETCTRELGPGERGELVITGPTIMKEYLDEPEETADAVMVRDQRRWLRTGDIGSMDELGRVALLDRKKQLIKVKGLSVFPREVEELLAMNRMVADVAVAGVPDKETGEAVKAWVVPREAEGESLTREALIDWCRRSMSNYKVPAHIEFIDEIPRNNLGKVMRKELARNDPLSVRTNA